MSLALFGLLLCLPALASADPGERFLARSQPETQNLDRRLEEQPKSEGEQCGTGGSDDCAMGLKCVSNTCHKVCGVFGPSGEKVFGTCSLEGQTCSGKAPTPCSVRDGECYMYCNSADRRLEEQRRPPTAELVVVIVVLVVLVLVLVLPLLVGLWWSA